MSPRDGPVPTSTRRLLQRPGLIGAILVVATLGVAGALAYQAARAAASHRAAVEATLQHHAATAAWRFAREARGWVQYGMNDAGNALQREVARHAVWPGPEVLQRVLAEKYCDCMTAAFGRTFVRVAVAGDPTLDLIGEPLSERARDELRDRMLALAAETNAGGEMARHWTILPPGTPRLNRGSDVALLWRVSDRESGVRGVYGMVVERAQIERPLIGALEGAQFFPPSLVSPSAARALVRVEVAGPNAVPLFASGPETRSFVGTDTLGAAYGNMVATAAINPATAQALVAGGLPSSRVPMIIALLVLALAMGGAAAIVLRREQRLARLREDFVSGVSHELRTPLTHIRMLSELLQTDGFKSPAERSRAIGVINRESLRLTNLVDNILEFARLRRTVAANGRDIARVALGEVLREVADALGPLLEAQGNRLEIVATGDVERVEVSGDRDAVGRILRNLVENAAKYGPASQTIRMTLSRSSSNGAQVTVDDEGPGIPPDERSRIWQPYYRLDRDRNAPAGGSGLGLSVVADLVRLLGGNVSVGEAPGKGARFTVEFPGVA
jgi:signal transduction histidine kinase